MRKIWAFLWYQKSPIWSQKVGVQKKWSEHAPLIDNYFLLYILIIIRQLKTGSIKKQNFEIKVTQNLSIYDTNNKLKQYEEIVV